VARKKHAEKEGKATCKRKRNVAQRKKRLIVIGLGFLTNILMVIIL
jgi:hypothetical protein